MPFPVAAALGLGGSVISGLFGRSGQASANAANAKLASENRKWQKMMSDTAHQRETKDLEAAGLNRILGLGGGGATTPAGNLATMENENKPLQDGIQGGISSAIQAAIAKATIENTKARTELTEAQTKAIQPGVALGEGVETAKGVGTRLMEEIKLGPPKARAGLTLTQQRRAQKLKTLAKSVGLSEQAIPRLLDAIQGMDLPKEWDGDQKIIWALNNPERVRAYLQRNRR